MEASVAAKPRVKDFRLRALDGMKQARLRIAPSHGCCTLFHWVDGRNCKMGEVHCIKV